MEASASAERSCLQSWNQTPCVWSEVWKQMMQCLKKNNKDIGGGLVLPSMLIEVSYKGYEGKVDCTQAH